MCRDFEAGGLRPHFEASRLSKGLSEGSNLESNSDPASALDRMPPSLTPPLRPHCPAIWGPQALAQTFHRCPSQLVSGLTDTLSLRTQAPGAPGPAPSETRLGLKVLRSTPLCPASPIQPEVPPGKRPSPARSVAAHGAPRTRLQG